MTNPMTTEQTGGRPERDAGHPGTDLVA